MHGRPLVCGLFIELSWASCARIHVTFVKCVNFCEVYENWGFEILQFFNDF